MDNLLWALFFGYPIVQIFSIIKTEKWWRLFSVLPLIPMIYVIIETAKLYSQASNLWPIVYLFTAPIALLYLIILLAINKVVRDRRI